MEISELIDLLNTLVTSENLTKKQKNSLTSKIKRSYTMIISELKVNGANISSEDLDALTNILLPHYDKIKNNSTMNEVMMQMAKDYETADVDGETSESIEKKRMNIHQHVLGNPGSSITGMSSDYIAQIIRLKLAEENGINRDDVMNILTMHSRNMYMDIEEYQKLINDSVVSYLTYNPNGENFSNPKIFGIFESLAASYKVQGDFDKVRQIYEQALKINNLRKSPEYSELKKNYNRFLEFLEMKKDFKDVKFDSFENLMASLRKKYTTDPIFVKEEQTPDHKPDSKIPKPPTHDKYVMPTEKKLEAFEHLYRTLKRWNPTYDLKECEIGKDSYEGYVIFKIEGTNISILENFATQENEALFIVKNEVIDLIKPLTKREAKSLPGVESVNHIKDFDNYCSNLISKTKKLIRQTQKEELPEIDDEELRFDIETPTHNIISDDLSPITTSTTQEQKQYSENDKSHTDDTTIIDDSSKNDKTVTTNKSTNAETTGNNENESSDDDRPLTKLEAERQKALKFREGLHQLEQELTDLEKKYAEQEAQIHAKYAKGETEHPSHDS